MPTFKILLFSVLKQKVGKKEIRIPVETPVTGTRLLDELVLNYPVLADYRPIIRLAVNHEYTAEESALQEGDEIALITPVSGG